MQDDVNPLDPQSPEISPNAWEKFWEDQFIWDEIWWEEPKVIKATDVVRRKRKTEPEESGEDEDEDNWEPEDVEVYDSEGNLIEEVEVDFEVIGEDEAGESSGFMGDFGGDLSDEDDPKVELKDDVTILLDDEAEVKEPSIKEDADTGRKVTWWDPESIEVVDHRKRFVYKDAKGRVQQRFPTAKDYLAYVNSPLPEDVDPKQAIHLRKAGYWQNSTEDWAEANRIAREGWPEGVAAVKKLKAKITSVAVGLIPDVKVKHQEVGEMLDIGRFVEGDPEMFMQMVDEGVREEKRKPQVVRIITTVDTTWSREGFINRGAAVLAVVGLLEQHGYLVQLDSHIGSNNVVDTWIRVKNTEDRVNIEKAVFWCGHPMMFSRMSYAAWCHMDAADRQRAGGLATRSYGWISEPAADERGDIYVSALNSAWASREETTIKWVLDTLREQGIEVKAE